MKPTIKQMREWWEHCENHMRECSDENCELYWQFKNFRYPETAPHNKPGMEIDYTEYNAIKTCNE